jgi:hypothetical protein
MGTAYTPGLIVSASHTVEKVRRLPLKGRILVEKGAGVSPQQVVAEADLPGDLETVRISQQLGVEPVELGGRIAVGVGDRVSRGTLLASVKTFFGFFTTTCTSPIDGTVEYYSSVTGHMGIRRPPVPVRLTAYMRGVIKEVIPEEGVVVESCGAFIQGIFGVGGERQGHLRVVVGKPSDPLESSRIPKDAGGHILVGGGYVDAQALRQAEAAGATGVVVGGIRDEELEAFLGYRIGVAVTGHEQIPLTLIVTEGFGVIPMAERTFSLLKSLEGKESSVNGTTQIRAGALRPEVIVPAVSAAGSEEIGTSGGQLRIGTAIRLIRVPHFGMRATVVALPQDPVLIATGARVRVLEAALEDGRRVTVPRANVELME